MEAIVLTEAVYYILLSLMQPLHGYGIMQHIATLSNGRVNLAAGTLYGALSALLDKGWIVVVPNQDDSRKKDYVITPLGRKVVRHEMERLHELLRNGTAIMGGESDA